jgi:hypothetical protein
MLYNGRTQETSTEIQMNKLAIAFLAAASLASFGCKKKGGGETVEAMKKYKTELCACKDHDTECGKKATDAYMKAQPADGAKTAESGKPDPEQDKLTADIADCSKRVMMPAPADTAGAAGGAAPAGGSDTGSAGSAAGSDTGAAAPAAGGTAPAAGSDSGSAGSGSAK